MLKLILLVTATVVACDANAITKSVQIDSYVMFYVYTRNSGTTQVFPDATSINNTQMLASRRTVFVVHGHEGSAFSTLNPLVQHALLDHEDLNVIVIDWSVFAGQSYSMATSTVPTVAERLAEFINILVGTGMATYSELHLVGFNLGAHLVGITGRILRGQVGRITGLDPSGSDWSATNRLRQTDALYVEVIHTDGGGIFGNGIGTAIGTVDFFVNGGSNQPGCVTHTCSHNRAYELFAASLAQEESHLVGRQCSNSLQISLNTCRGATLAMGSNVLIKRGAGSYRVNTASRYPY